MQGEARHIIHEVMSHYSVTVSNVMRAEGKQ